MPRISPKNATYIGIDPGKSGGLAAIVEGSPEAVPMPATERDVWDWFDQWNPRGDVFAIIEKVGGYTGEGQPGSAMFNFGMGYGGLRMALIGAGIPFEDATPQRWQKTLGIPPRKKTESKTQWKNRLKAKAQQLFPKMHVTLSTADALLIAEFCRRKQEGNL